MVTWAQHKASLAQLPPAATVAAAAAAAAAVSGSLLSATSLAAAAQGVLRADVLVDASRPCAADVWQVLFRYVGALLLCICCIAGGAGRAC
jgi:hypothetical protein